MDELVRGSRRLPIDLNGSLAVLFGVIAFAMIAALTLGNAPAQAAFPGANGTIACGGLRGTGTDLEVFQVNVDGTGESVLTSNDFRDGSPAYSPDGTKIAFESQRNPVAGQPANTEIYVANNDGDLEGPDVKRLTFNAGQLPNGTFSAIAATDFSPSWSPDGTQIVFHSGRVATFNDGGVSPTNDFEIYRMSAVDGESVTPANRLTFNRGQDAIPSWSPDGTKIAWQGFPAGNQAVFNNNLEVWTMNTDGSGRLNVSQNEGTPNNPGTPVNENLNGLDRDIIWSPDGKQIAFNSARASAVPGNQNNDVYRANRDGSGLVRLTTNADSPEPGAFTDFDVPLVWSPDGKTILFASSRESTPSTDAFFAYTMNAVAGDSDTASVQRVAAVAQFQRCDWRALAIPAPVVPAPVAPAVVPPAPTPADTLAPTGRMLLGSRNIRRSNLFDSNGLRVPVEVSEGARVQVDMYLDNGASLPRLRSATSKPKLALLGRGVGTRQTAGRVAVNVKPTSFGRTRLRRTARTRVIVVATLRDLAGNQRRLARAKAVVRVR